MVGIIGEQISDFYVSGADILDADQYSNYLAVTTTSGQISIVDLNNDNKNTFVVFGSSPAGATFQMPFSTDAGGLRWTSSTQIACCFPAHATPIIYDFSTNTSTTLASIGNALNKTQVIAADTVNNKAMYLVSGSGGNHIGLINVGTVGASLLTPSLGGASTTCIIKKANGILTNPYFVVGTDDGRILEMTVAGVINSTINMPLAITDGTGSTKQVPDQMAMIGDTLYVISKEGALIQFSYTAGTVVNQRTFNGGSTGTPATGCISQVQQGFIAAATVVTDSSPNPLILYAIPDVNGSATLGGLLVEVDRIYLNSENKIVATGLNADTNLLWVCWDLGRSKHFLSSSINRNYRRHKNSVPRRYRCIRKNNKNSHIPTSFSSIY